jgi:hypothetical protein
MSDSTNVVGHSVSRIDTVAKATGAARYPGLSRRNTGRDRPLWQESLEGRRHRRGDPRPGWNLPIRGYPDPGGPGHPLKRILLASIALLLAVIACGPAATSTPSLANKARISRNGATIGNESRRSRRCC